MEQNLTESNLPGALFWPGPFSQPSAEKRRKGNDLTLLIQS